MGYPEILLCFQKEKGNQGPFPPFIFPASNLKYLTGHIASFMNLEILVLTIYVHATTSLESVYLFKIMFSGKVVQANFPLC